MVIASARLASRNREAVILLFCADGKTVEGINETAAGVMLCAGVAEAERLGFHEMCCGANASGAAAGANEGENNAVFCPITN